jgi:TRAP-type C4-dicarboxylate transport system substrate-binding protein
MTRISKFVAALCGLLIGGNAVAATTTFKVATIVPDGTYWMTRIRAAADEVASRTEGRVQFKFYPGGVMGNDEAVLRKIRAGQLHGGMLTGGSLGAVYPDTQIYSLPLLFNSFAEVDYVRARMDALILQGLEKNGFIGFGIGDGGFALVFATDPVRSVDDMKGRKVWIPPNDPITRAMFEAAGLSPVMLPLSDVMTGLQSGMIDTMGSSPVGAVALQWYTKLKYATDTPLLYLYGIVVVDKRTFSRLNSADQALVREIMGKAMKDMDVKNRADDRGARDALRHEGLEFVAISPQGLAQWKDVARKARENLARSGAYSEAMLKTLQGHLNDFRGKQKAAR